MKGIRINRKNLAKQMKGKKTAKKARSEFLDRWARLSGLEMDENGKYDYSKIDYENNKYVRLEYLLCDPKILTSLGQANREKSILELIPEDLLETFYSVGPGCDKPYSEVYLNKSSIQYELEQAKAQSEGKQVQ